jgi:general stress protein 26
MMGDPRFASSDLTEVAQLLREIDICMFVTHADGGLRGRPMSNNGAVEYDGDSWFFTLRDTPKVRELEADPWVALAYIATESGRWLSIEGRASIEDDAERKRALWMADLERWFPNGPDDPAIVLIKASAERIHAWTGEGELVLEPGRPATRIPA